MSFSFPILNNQEILACLAELDLHIPEADLLKPTYEVIRPVFEGIVQLLVGVTREELHQPIFRAMDLLEYPELHEESIGSLSFDRALCKLMDASGFHDFTLKDLYKPDHKRVRRSLSAVINFAKFREEKLAAYHELQARSDVLLERRAAVEEMNAGLKAEIQKILDERASQQPMVQQLTGETNALAATIAQLNTQQAALHRDVKQTKHATNELQNKIDNAKITLMDARNENAALAAQVVQSPQKLQRALEELRAAVEEERGAISGAEKKCRALQAKLEGISKVGRETQRTLKLLEEVEAEVARRKDASHQVKAMRAQVQGQEAELCRLDSEQQQLMRQAQSAEERLDKFEQRAQQKKEAAAAAVEAAQEGRSAREHERAAALAHAEEIEAKIKDLQAQMANVRATHTNEISAMVAKYDALRVQVRSFNAALSAAMEPDKPFPLLSSIVCH